MISVKNADYLKSRLKGADVKVIHLAKKEDHCEYATIAFYQSFSGRLQRITARSLLCRSVSKGIEFENYNVN